MTRFKAALLIVSLGISLPLRADVSSEKTTPPPHQPSFVYGAWLPYWGINEGKQSLKRKHGLNHLSPVWYEVNSDGSLKVKIKASAQSLKQTAQQQQLGLTPSIAIFDYKLLSKVIGTQANRNRHIDAIVAEVEKHQFDGIDIDYEAIAQENKEDYFLFLEGLASKLHANHKQLSVTVLSKWGDQVDYPLFPQTRKVQDWTRIAKLADQVRIMAYDYTMATSTYPGPIAPNHWADSVLRYATGRIPKSKIILGIHLYGFEWSSPESSQLKFQPNITENPLRKKRVRSFTEDVIQNILRQNKGVAEHYEGETIFRYHRKSKSGINSHRVLVFPSQTGIDHKIKLARQHGIKGVYFWRLGNEGQLLSKIQATSSDGLIKSP